MELLTTYKENLLAGYKKTKQDASLLRAEIKDTIFNNLCLMQTFEASADSPDNFKAQSRRNSVYYLCGYMLNTRHNLFSSCEECKSSLSTTKDLLPAHFDAAAHQILKNQGGLKYCTETMFNTFNEI